MVNRPALIRATGQRPFFRAAVLDGKDLKLLVVPTANLVNGLAEGRGRGRHLFRFAFVEAPPDTSRIWVDETDGTA